MRYKLLGKSGLRVSELCLAKLDEASKIELGFPHDFVAGARHMIFGDTFDQIDNHRA